MRGTERDLSTGYARMFQAAIQSRSASNSQTVQRYVRSDSSRDALTAPQPLSVLEDGYPRSTLTNSVPYRRRLYSRMDRNSARPASEMILACRAWPYRGGLVVVVPTQVRDTGIQPAVQALPAVGGPVLAVCLSEPGEGLVDLPQFGQGVLQGFRVLSGGAVGQRGQQS